MKRRKLIQSTAMASAVLLVACASTTTAKPYDAVAADKPIYNRFESSLLLADGMPKMLESVENAGLFELCIYEDYSEDAMRRKIKIFNKKEIPLFHEVGLHPLFFGDMINFTDMEQRNANWGKFLEQPDWNAMKVKPEYANSISNIRKIFLEPIS